MKKSLILFTALFAGTMLISNDICADNVLNQNDDQENVNANANVQAPIDDQEQAQEQRNLEKGAINSNLVSETPTEIVLKLREEIGLLFEKTQIKEIARYNHNSVQEIKHNIMISNNKDKLKFAIEQVEEFLKITTEYGYESLQPEQKQYIFYKIMESHDPCEVNLTHAKTIEFLRIANMNGYENIINKEKNDIFNDIFYTNDFRSCKAKVQEIKSKYNLS